MKTKKAQAKKTNTARDEYHCRETWHPADFEIQGGNLVVKMMSENVDQICSALIKAQKSIATVTKTKSVNLSGPRGYKYAPLECLIEEALPKLNKEGIALTQIIWPDDDGRLKLWSILLHSSGQYLSSQYPLNLQDGANAHAIGSAITYARKYTFAPQAGLAVQDEDDDAAQVVAPKVNRQPSAPNPDRRYQQHDR